MQNIPSRAFNLYEFLMRGSKTISYFSHVDTHFTFPFSINFLFPFFPPHEPKKKNHSRISVVLCLLFFFFFYLTRRKAKYKCVHPANAIVHGNSCAYSTLCIPVAKTSTKQRHLFNRNAPPFLAVNDLK